MRHGFSKKRTNNEQKDLSGRTKSVGEIMFFDMGSFYVCKADHIVNGDLIVFCKDYGIGER